MGDAEIIYDWDPAKAASNAADHGVPFDVAPLVFAGLVQEVEDTRFPYPETRWQAYGYINGRLFQCVYTWRGGGRCRWVISRRKTNRREVQRYG